MIQDSHKCIITTIEKENFLVITYRNINKSFSRLPLLEEVEPKIIENNQHILNGETSILILTEELSPWHIFTPFPPSQDYEDYGYISFLDKGGKGQTIWGDKKTEIFSLWQLLPSDEMSIVNETIVKLNLGSQN